MTIIKYKGHGKRSNAWERYNWRARLWCWWECRPCWHWTSFAIWCMPQYVHYQLTTVRSSFFRTVGLACFQYDARCAGEIFCIQFQHSHQPYPSRVTHTLSDLFVGLTKMDEDWQVIAWAKTQKLSKTHGPSVESGPTIWACNTEG